MIKPLPLIEENRTMLNKLLCQPEVTEMRIYLWSLKDFESAINEIKKIRDKRNALNIPYYGLLMMERYCISVMPECLENLRRTHGLIYGKIKYVGLIPKLHQYGIYAELEREILNSHNGKVSGLVCTGV